MSADKPKWLWSQAFANDFHHAIPAADHDPLASGWIAVCGTFCCGEAEEDVRSNREMCPTCQKLTQNPDQP